MGRKVTPFPTGYVLPRLANIAIHGNAFNARVAKLASKGLPSYYLDIFRGYRDATPEERGVKVLQLERFEKFKPEIAVKHAATIKSKYAYAADKALTKEINKVLRDLKEPIKIENTNKQKPFSKRQGGTLRALDYINTPVRGVQFKEQYINAFKTVIGNNPSKEEKKILHKLKRLSVAKIYALQYSNHDYTDVGFWYQATQVTQDYTLINDLMEYISQL